MMPEPRWDLAITHRAAECVAFVKDYFDDPRRSVLLIAGAGFDPRATILADTIGALSMPKVRAVCVRENRTGARADPDLHRQADLNFAQLTGLIPDNEVLLVDVFSPDGSVIGGRSAALKMNGMDLSGITDVIVDVSALSIGISFPIIRWVLEVPAEARPDLNVHLFVAHKPELDSQIRATPSDTPVRIHRVRWPAACAGSGPENREAVATPACTRPRGVATPDL